MATVIFWPSQQTNQSRLIANLFNFCIFYLILIKFGLGAKWVVLNHSGDFWMSFWTAQAFPMLLPTSNWQQSSSLSKLNDYFPVRKKNRLEPTWSFPKLTYIHITLPNPNPYILNLFHNPDLSTSTYSVT